MGSRSEQIERNKQRLKARQAALRCTLRRHDAALRAEQKKDHAKRLAGLVQYMETIGIFAYEDDAIKEALHFACDVVLNQRGAPHESAPTPQPHGTDHDEENDASLSMQTVR